MAESVTTSPRARRWWFRTASGRHERDLRDDSAGHHHRVLTFTAGALTVSVELTPDALLGQLVPPSAAAVELRHPGGVVASTSADEVGWFALRPAPEGLFRLRVRTGTRPDVHTEWTRA